MKSQNLALGKKARWLRYHGGHCPNTQCICDHHLPLIHPNPGLPRDSRRQREGSLSGTRSVLPEGPVGSLEPAPRHQRRAPGPSGKVRGWLHGSFCYPGLLTWCLSFLGAGLCSCHSASVASPVVLPRHPEPEVRQAQDWLCRTPAFSTTAASLPGPARSAEQERPPKMPHAVLAADFRSGGGTAVLPACRLESEPQVSDSRRRGLESIFSFKIISPK